MVRHHHDEGVPVAHGQGRRARHALVWGVVLLLATGVGWLLGHDVWLQQTPFGAQPHPLAAWLLRAHGAIAWCAAVVGGVVWQIHVRPAWRSVRRRRDHRRRNPALGIFGRGRARTVTGVALVIALAVLLATAIGLQYAPEQAHAWLSVTHWVVGLVLGAALLWHWLARLRG